MQSNVYTVSWVNKYIKNMFQNDYLLENIRIKGEISNLKYHSSGHIYFTLKDEKSAIKAVMFSFARNTGLDFTLKEGMQVEVTGSVDVYERDGAYQVYAKKIIQAGIGNLFEEFEKLKAKLEEQGMFDPCYKRPIPKYVHTLGVVTASTGAAVRDIIDVSKRRNPGISIVLYPAIVQGEEAPESIVQGIKALEKYGVDTIIVGRGGGSMEDLWGFNDERVAQAIFDCSIPVISAVGHETDFTIADFVSDLRAPTPSAAAELAVCDVSSLIMRLDSNSERLDRGIGRAVLEAKKKNQHYYERLRLLSPENKLRENKLKLKAFDEKISHIMEQRLLNCRHRLKVNAGLLQGLSPLSKLAAGYSFVTDESGKSVKNVNDVKIDDTLTINVTNGLIKAVVKDKKES